MLHRPKLETRNMVFFMLTWSPLLCIPAFHALSLEVHSSRAGHYWREALTAYQCRTHSKAPPAPGWKALMHTFLTVLTIDPHRTPSIGVHALDDMHSPFLAPRSLRPTAIVPTLVQDQWLSQGHEGKVEWFVSGDVFFPCYIFTHSLQDCLIGTGMIMWFPWCQWSNKYY